MLAERLSGLLSDIDPDGDVGRAITRAVVTAAELVAPDTSQTAAALAYVSEDIDELLNGV